MVDRRPRQVFYAGWHARCGVEGCAYDTSDTANDGAPTKAEALRLFREHDCHDSDGNPLEA